MVRFFIYLLIILGLGIGFAWIADRPGVVTLAWGGKEYETSLMVMAVALVALIFSIMFIWAIIRGIIKSPILLSRFFETRRRDRGYAALSKGLIAAGTGDTAAARRLAKESSKLLKSEPLVALLDAQTAILEGKRDQARARFSTMLEDDDTKLLGLRGLYLEAEREGEKEASRQFAEKAAELAPSLAWAGKAKLKYQMLDGDWETALATLEQHRSAGLIKKPVAKRHRAVLLTALANSVEPKDPNRAAKLAKEANRLAPEFVPAATIGAAAYARGGSLRKASKLIESVWKKEPHPELAQSYVHLRMGDSAKDRLKRAQALAKLRPNHPEGNIAIAEAAIDAGDWPKAREAMKPVLINNLTERACLIMADIEEGESGDKGRMRDWLSRAVRSPRDARWTSGSYTSETWLPISPVTGEIDAFEWRVPVEQLGGPGEPIDIGDLSEPLKPDPDLEEASSKTNTETLKTIAATSSPIAVSGNNDNDEKLDEKTTGSGNDPDENTQDEKAKSNEAEVIEANVVEVVDDKSGEDSTQVQDSDTDVAAKGDADKDDKTSTDEEPNAESTDLENQKKELVDGGEGTAQKTDEVEKPEETQFPLKRRPDDPGIVPDKKETEAGNRFKLF